MGCNILRCGKIPVDFNHIIMRNKDTLINLKTTQQNNIEAIWAPSHEGIQINEKADVAAREEAKKSVNDQRPLERKIVLTNLKHQVLTSNWQRRVNHESKNQRIYFHL